jgi:hypothetical protein
MENRNKLAAPCGLYCGVCGILIAHRDHNIKFKERLTTVYGVSIEEIQCEGCLSDKLFGYCQTCPIRSCAMDGGRRKTLSLSPLWLQAIQGDEEMQELSTTR